MEGGLASTPDPNAVHNTSLHFALGKACGDVGKYRKAFTKLLKDDMPFSYDLAERSRYGRMYEELMALAAAIPLTEPEWAVTGTPIKHEGALNDFGDACKFCASRLAVTK